MNISSIINHILPQIGALSRAAVFWHFPCYIGRGEPGSEVHMGDWKLIEKWQPVGVRGPGESPRIRR